MWCDIRQPALIADNDSNQLWLIPEDELEDWRRKAQLLALRGCRLALRGRRAGVVRVK
jgi:hypothetical protein